MNLSVNGVVLLVRRFVYTSAVLFFFVACVSATRPTTDLIFASAALKAAERVSAEKKAPDQYNRAQTAYWKASKHMLAKEFEEATQASLDARRLAERAELEAELRNMLPPEAK